MSSIIIHQSEKQPGILELNYVSPRKNDIPQSSEFSGFERLNLTFDKLTYSVRTGVGLRFMRGK